MPASSVWVQLYYQDHQSTVVRKMGRTTSVNKPTNLEENEWNIDAFIEAAKAKLKIELDHAGSTQIFVYPPDTEPPFLQDKAIDPDDDAPTDTSSKTPLIVVAPDPATVSEAFRIDVSWCKLPSRLLQDYAELSSYFEAAKTCASNEEVLAILGELGTYNKRMDFSQEFSCIIAPSGTGKSQLAATAAMTNKWNVVYFYTGSGDAETVQDFYKMHVPLRNTLMSALRDFAPRMHGGRSAADVRQYTGSHSLFHLLFECFFEGDSKTGTLAELRERIQEEAMALLVFLDEVPSSTSSNDEFELVMLLRNVIRATGVSPILMSTHTGAINAVAKGSDSRVSDKRWCRVFVKLPKYQLPQKQDRAQFPWLCESERPLVAAMMVHEDVQSDNICTIVDHVQEKLQRSKKLAWTTDPALQLCQLFRSKGSAKIQDAYKHRIVGCHFGHICQSEGRYFQVDREESSNWVEHQVVQFVNPEKEPILFLALASWKMDQVDEQSPRFFPLVSHEETNSSKRRRLSIRGAFESSSYLFTKPVDTGNDLASKLDGDDLEVLALAAITLASLQSESDTGIFEEVGIATFLANIFHFMAPGRIDRDGMCTTASCIIGHLRNTAFSGKKIPACPSYGSAFDTVWGSRVLPPSQHGKLVRLEDRQGRDGYMECNGTTVLHVECKNLTGGLTTEVFKKVVSRMRVSCNLSLLFTSDIRGLFAKEGSFLNFQRQELGLEGDELCFLVLDYAREKPYWLKLKDKTPALKPGAGTRYLMVLIATGAVAPSRKPQPRGGRGGCGGRE